jgi:membrane associated rhomboid family serine protease
MKDQKDFGKYTEADLLEIASHIDVNGAGENFGRLKTALEAKGYVVQANARGQAIVSLSEGARQQTLDASVFFGGSAGVLSWMQPSRNNFRLVGKGRIVVGSATVHIWGKVMNFILGLPISTQIMLDRERISNVEIIGESVRLEYSKDGARPKALTLRLLDAATAGRLAGLLPAVKTLQFRANLPMELEFEERVFARHRQIPVTLALASLNILVFLAMLISGGGLLQPTTSTLLKWGSNFGPYTTDGDWWRLLTSMFLHLGLFHLVLNMWALVAVGQLVERLYGSRLFLFLYLCAGIAGSLSSVIWSPTVNSVGASGAIFGIYGALLAALFGPRHSIPSSLVRPLRNSTLVLVLYPLAAGLSRTGIDNAAHLGGLMAGFLVGLALSRYRAMDKDRQGKGIWAALLAAIIILAVGVGAALLRTSRGGPEVAVWQTQHWLVGAEDIAVGNWMYFRRLVHDKKLDDAACAETIDSQILTYWREADNRLQMLRSPTDQGDQLVLKRMRALVNNRKSAFELCALACRVHDSAKFS